MVTRLDLQYGIEPTQVCRIYGWAGCGGREGIMPSNLVMKIVVASMPRCRVSSEKRDQQCNMD